MKKSQFLYSHITKTYEELLEHEVVYINPPTKRVIIALWPILLGYFTLVFSAFLSVITFAFIGIMSIVWIILYTISLSALWRICNFKKISLVVFHIIFFIFSVGVNIVIFQIIREEMQLI